MLKPSVSAHNNHQGLQFVRAQLFQSMIYITIERKIQALFFFQFPDFMEVYFELN